jgi:hypothetical protein
LPHFTNPSLKTPGRQERWSENTILEQVRYLKSRGLNGGSDVNRYGAPDAMRFADFMIDNTSHGILLLTSKDSLARKRQYEYHRIKWWGSGSIFKIFNAPDILNVGMF